MAYFLERQKTGTTPYILIDEASGYVKLAGESYNENVMDFFREINDWLDGYLAADLGGLTIDCALEYFNSSTSKLLYNIFVNLDDHAVGGKKITVNWITTSDNEIIIECGEDFQEDMENLTFNMVINPTIL
jgi:coenzyme F420-reducing hydrogenase delta subunit